MSITTHNMNLDRLNEAERYPDLVLFIHFERKGNMGLLVWDNKTMEVNAHYFEWIRNSRRKNRLKTAIVYADDEGAMRTYFAVTALSDWPHHMYTEINLLTSWRFFSYELDFNTFWNYKDWSQTEIRHVDEYATFFQVLFTMFNPGDDTWEQLCLFRNAVGVIVEESDAYHTRDLVCVRGDCGDPREVFETLEKYKGPLKRVMTKDDLIQIRLENVNLCQTGL